VLLTKAHPGFGDLSNFLRGKKCILDKIFNKVLNGLLFHNEREYRKSKTTGLVTDWLYSHQIWHGLVEQKRWRK